MKQNQNRSLNQKEKSQIWVETVIYTLIGLTIIGILLSVANPIVEKMRDKSILKQTIDAMDIMDKKISEIEQSAGSIGIVDFKIAKGRFIINGKENITEFVLEDTRLEFSQIGETIKEGNINIKTEEHGNRFNVHLIRNYSTIIDVEVDDVDPLTDKIKTLQAGSVPYKIYIENKGQTSINDLTDIVFRAE
jgi:hypothetical protein